MTAFPTPKELLAKYELSAKKSWGQNFLISERVYRAIVDAAVADTGDWIVEFGAGLGTLTMRLAERVAYGKVVCVERDRDLAKVLRNELGHLENIEVVEGNALTFDLKTVSRAQGRPLSVCGNLPYQIASRILVNTLDCGPDVVHKAVFMVQREVADRMLAPPGSKQYGALSVIVQTIAQVKKVVLAPPGAFLPSPKVASTVISLELAGSEESRAAGDVLRTPKDRTNHRKVVHTAFAQRRKTLANALRAEFSKEAVASALEVSCIDGKRRAETLSVEEFVGVSMAIAEVTDA